MPTPLASSRDAAVPAESAHTVPLGSTGWRVWRWGLLRAAGFPSDGVDRFAEPDLAAAADGVCGETGGADQAQFEPAQSGPAQSGPAQSGPAQSGPAQSGPAQFERARFDKEFDLALARLGVTLHELTGDPLFREAVTWQNPAAMRTMLDPVRRHGPAAPQTSSYRRQELTIARYWARYCVKNDSIGFFGPVCWVEVGDADMAVAARPGPGLVRARRTYLERWALAALGDRLAEDPAIRRWLPPKLQPMLALADGAVVHPVRGALPVGRAEAAVLAACDGRRPAVEVARRAVADTRSGLRREDDALLALG